MVDIPRLHTASAEVNASLVVDVTQSAGIMKINTWDWEADAVVTSGYKWLGGHGGVALAAMSNHLLKQAPPIPGWMGTANLFDFEAKVPYIMPIWDIWNKLVNLYVVYT